MSKYAEDGSALYVKIEYTASPRTSAYQKVEKVNISGPLQEISREFSNPFITVYNLLSATDADFQFLLKGTSAAGYL